MKLIKSVFYEKDCESFQRGIFELDKWLLRIERQWKSNKKVNKTKYNKIKQLKLEKIELYKKLFNRPVITFCRERFLPHKRII